MQTVGQKKRERKYYWISKVKADQCKTLLGLKLLR